MFSPMGWVFLRQLVAGDLTILKNMTVNGKDDIPYMKWKMKFMFETTNQIKNGVLTFKKWMSKNGWHSKVAIGP